MLRMFIGKEGYSMLMRKRATPITLSKTVNRLKPVLREDDQRKRKNKRATLGARRGSVWTAYQIS
jgi:hypothetical protein